MTPTSTPAHESRLREIITETIEIMDKTPISIADTQKHLSHMCAVVEASKIVRISRDKWKAKYKALQLKLKQLKQ